jgi:hypothetical protein
MNLFQGSHLYKTRCDDVLRIYHPLYIESCVPDLPIFYINREGTNVSGFLTQSNFIVNASDVISCSNNYEVYVGNEKEAIKKGKQIVQKAFSFSTEKLIQDEAWFDTVQEQIDENKNYQIVRDLFSYFSYFFFFSFGLIVKKIMPKIQAWIKHRKPKRNITITQDSEAQVHVPQPFPQSEKTTVELVNEQIPDKNCICPICNFKAKTPSGLKIHFSRTHKN